MNKNQIKKNENKNGIKRFSMKFFSKILSDCERNLSVERFIMQL